MKRANRNLLKVARFCAPCTALLWTATPAAAGWELGLKGGVDSNVTRAVEDEKSDTFLWGILAYTRDPSGENRLDWTLTAQLDGAVYQEKNDFDYAALSVSPGLSYVPFAGWTLSATPFLQGKAAKDDRQSALAWGVRISLQQQLSAAAYLAEHYTYTDSDADEDVFSFTEHAVGLTVGYNWTPRFVTEVSYQYARGDSFRTLDGQETSTAAPAKQGPGGPGSTGARTGSRRGIQGFGGEVVKDTVNNHQLSATLTYHWTGRLSSTLGYAYSLSDGDEDTSRSHVGSLGASYRF